jgi:hypothetical protein
VRSAEAEAASREECMPNVANKQLAIICHHHEKGPENPGHKMLLSYW